MITTELNSWITRELETPYTLDVLSRPVMTRSSKKYPFNVTGWSAHVLLNDKLCTLDFYQVGSYLPDDYHTSPLTDYLDFEDDRYQHLASKKDFIEFYQDINEVIIGFNLPLDILDPTAITKYELLNVKGYSASVGGIQAQLNTHDHVRNADIIREKWMPGRTEILARYYQQKKLLQQPEDN